MAAETTPATPSGDYDAQAPYWTQVQTMLDGVEAMRNAGKTYLPQFEKESDEHYEDRRKNARYTNIFADIVENLASKPFAEEVKLDEATPDAIVKLAANIDGRGNSVHGFAGEWFHAGIANAIDWVLVDYPKARPVQGANRPLSVAEETAQGLRPYWVRIPALRMLAVRSEVIGGEEVFYHVRFREDAVVADGYEETLKKRVREFNRAPIYANASDVKPAGFAPAVWILWEEQKDEATGKTKWVDIDTGTVSIGVIPAVPFITGRRKGATWQFIPPMKGAADLQIEHFQLETALKWIAGMTAYPMLAGNGVTPEMEGGKVKPAPVGPRAVVYAPPIGDTGQHGEWVWIEPSGESLNFLKDYVAATEKELRELGRQPLTAESGNLTVVTTAFAAQKGNSACQAWALNLQAALERALKLTAMWLKVDAAPEVAVYTDFAIELDDKGPDTLMAMRKNGDLSRETLWKEARRRNILSADFDAKQEQVRLDAELPDPADLENMAAALGLTVSPPPAPVSPPPPAGPKPAAKPKGKAA